MYHHRYQPSHLANKTATAFASNNYTINSYPSSLSASSIAATTNTNINHRYNNNNNTNNNDNSYNNRSHAGPIQNHIVEERQDVIFRKVRGILNKITPETFDKLTKELVNVGLNSPRTLRGVIYLLFDKALKDLKYSSLYAKLCQELSEKAPNFEQEPGPNTFCKFLISKCEDEFERRRKATEDFDGKNELTDEEYEQKAIAKQKMLGNIKFICELGKKRLLQEEILHECIRGLLSKKKERPIQDQAQDLECLCQIMRTIGSLLDVQASRNLMNQYFERIDLFSKKPELPSRIRFMLRDVIDLRNNNWRPRPFQREDNVPQTLSKLREEANYDLAASSTTDKFGNSRNLISIGDLSRLHGDKLSMLIDDGPSFTTSTDFHWGSAFTPLDHHFDAFSSSNTTTAVKPTTSATVSRSNISSSTMPLSVNQVFHKSASFQHDNPIPDSMGMRFDKPHSVMNSPGLKHPGGDTRRFLDGLSFDRRPFSETNVGNVRNGRDSPIKFRAPVAVNHNQPRVQPREIHQISNNINRRNDRDERQQTIKSPTRDNISPDTRPTNPRRHMVDSNTNTHHQSNHRFDLGPSNNESVSDNRERRFHRNDHQERESRHPRFSNNPNHRRARNDKPPIAREHNYFERSGQPESELNLNWRAGPVNVAPARTTNNTSDSSSLSASDIQKPAYKRNNDKFPESITESNRITKPSATVNMVNNRSNNQIRKPDELYIEKRSLLEKSTGINYNDEGSPVLKPRGSPIDHIGAVQQHQNHLIGQPSNQIRFTEVDQVNRTTNPPPGRGPSVRRPPYEQFNQAPTLHPSAQQNHRQNPRTIQSEIADKREPRKLYPSVAQDSSGPSQARNHENSAAFHQERNYRHPPNERGFILDHHHDNDSEKHLSWRRGTNFSVNTMVREPQLPPSQPQSKPQPASKPQPVPKPQPQQTPNLSPLLSRPPTKSDLNFSLRPSHNLVGRAGVIIGGSNLKLVNPKIESTIKTDEKSPDGQESLDSSKTSSKGFVRNQSENVQVSSKAPLPLPVKLLAPSETISDGGNKVASTNGSPTRAAARDSYVSKFISVISDKPDESSPNVSRIVNKIKELKIPKSYQHECLVSAMKRSILRSECDRNYIGKLFVQLIPSVFEIPSLLSAFKVIFEQMHALEVETPKVKSLVAGFLSRAIMDELIGLDEVGNVLSGGKHHPLFLLCLQKLEKNVGQAWLNEKLTASKINLMDMLPEVDRSKDRLASILRDRCLGFLDPMLTIEPDLWEQMKERDASPAGLYRWIKDNVDQAIQGTPTFVHVLMTCLLKYIHHAAIEKSKLAAPGRKESDESCEAPESNKSSPSSSSQSTSDIENELLTKYQQVLQALLKVKQMQLATLYSVQSFYHELDFPKGALLRWFHMLYDMNIVDDDVFFIWKEEINDEYPGKGQALFQVNTWLNWLAEAESEEEEDV